MNPKWLTRGEVPKQNLDEEITAISKTMKENANEKQKEMIIKGKLQKFYENNVFTDMEYLLDCDSELTIGNYINLLEKELEIPKGSLQIGRTLTLSVKWLQFTLVIDTITIYIWLMNRESMFNKTPKRTNQGKMS